MLNDTVLQAYCLTRGEASLQGSSAWTRPFLSGGLVAAGRTHYHAVLYVASMQRRLSMASDLDSHSLFAKSVATAPRAAAGQLYPYDFAVGHPAAEALPCQECVEATAAEGIKRLAGVVAR